jgi:hypothetical protein
MTARKAPAPPVANLAQAKRQQAALRQAEAEAKQRHPAGKAQAPAAKKLAPATKPASKKVAATLATEAQKVEYQATARCGKVNSRTSATPLAAALDVKISGKKNAAWSAGVIVAFYATAEAAQKVADEINGGAVDGWSDAIVVAATATAKAAS